VDDVAGYVAANRDRLPEREQVAIDVTVDHDGLAGRDQSVSPGYTGDPADHYRRPRGARAVMPSGYLSRS
jgi:hypothetical protein